MWGRIVINLHVIILYHRTGVLSTNFRAENHKMRLKSPQKYQNINVDGWNNRYEAPYKIVFRHRLGLTLVGKQGLRIAKKCGEGGIKLAAYQNRIITPAMWQGIIGKTLLKPPKKRQRLV